MTKSLRTAFTVDKRDADGVTLLMECARQGTYQRLLQCLDEGSAIDAVDHAGNNALMHAIDRKQTEMATVLIARGIDTAHCNASGSTALMQACAAKEMPEVIERLLQKKVALDVQSEKGNTALMLACAAGDGWAACKLVDAGADFEKLHNLQGRTAMDLAAEGLSPRHYALLRACVDAAHDRHQAAATAETERQQQELARNVHEATVLQRDVTLSKPVAFRPKPH